MSLVPYIIKLSYGYVRNKKIMAGTLLTTDEGDMVGRLISLHFSDVDVVLEFEIYDWALDKLNKVRLASDRGSHLFAYGAWD